MPRGAYLDRRAVPLAVGLLALGDHLLYYSSEIKQYSCDLVIALAALLLAAPRPPEQPTGRRLKALAIFGVIAPWFSFTSVFVLAGVGLHLFVTAALRKDRRKIALITCIGLAWLISFAGCFLLSRSIMSRRDFLWVWWNFAFLPVPPRSLADASLLAESIANVFINPASILTPFALPYTAVLASIMALIGCLSLGRRGSGGLFLLLSPLVFALAASGLHQYPFHGRLLLGLVPTFQLLLSEGVAALGRRSGWLVTLALAGCFLYGEAAEVLWHRAIQAPPDVRFSRRPQERPAGLPRIPAQSSRPPGPTQHLGSPRPREPRCPEFPERLAARSALAARHRDSTRSNRSTSRPRR